MYLTARRGVANKLIIVDEIRRRVRRVTLEDVVREIVGEASDEAFDQRSRASARAPDGPSSCPGRCVPTNSHVAQASTFRDGPPGTISGLVMNEQGAARPIGSRVNR